MISHGFDIDVIVVEPVYQLNIGYIARTAKNFDVKNLKLVNPKCKHLGKKAIMYSKHGRDLLESASVYKSIKEAGVGSFIIGSTAIAHKSNAALYNVYTPEVMREMIKNNKRNKISIVLGRESTGLTRNEITECDATITIPINSSYRVLNISHALAVMLYGLRLDEMHISTKLYAEPKQVNGIVKLFAKMINKRDDIRSKDTVTNAFEHIIKRANPTKKELNAISIAFYAPKEYKKKK